MNTRIANLRKSLSLTQDEFGKRIGLSRNFIWMVEKGERIPSDRTIQDICAEFHVNEVWLRTGAGDPFKDEPRMGLIAKFAAKTISGSDEFKKAFVSMLAKLDAEDWEALARLYQKLSNEIDKKSE